MISKKIYVNENFPIEQSLIQDVCNFVYNAIYKHPAIIQSGLYNVESVYNLKETKTNHFIFKTFFNGEDYAEILVSKIKEKGNLEIKLFGRDYTRLSRIRFELKNKIENKLEKHKNDKKKF